MSDDERALVELLQKVSKLVIEQGALLLALDDYVRGLPGFDASRYAQFLARRREQMQLRNSGAATPEADAILALLRAFEGPPQ